MDRRSENALDMESDGFLLRNKKRNFDRGQIPVFKIPLPLQLQVNEKWSLHRQLAKISLFLLFYAPEKNFQLKQNDRHSETTAKCPEKRYQLATFTNKKRKFNKLQENV